MWAADAALREFYITTLKEVKSMNKIVNRFYDTIEDVANFGLDFFFKFKRTCLVVFMWMCIICTALSLNIFTGVISFFIYFYLKRDKESYLERKKFRIMRTAK